jgi:DNA-binding transcriptional regulator YhcF (GntR family)
MAIPNLNAIKLANDTRSPKYRRIANAIIDAINRKDLVLGSQLPSINELSNEFSLSRDTIVKAYLELKSRGVIDSTHGKGFYVSKESIEHKLNMFLFFDEFSAYKEILYNALKKRLAGHANIDIFFHHYNIKLFESLIRDSMCRYNTYLIMPFNHIRMLEVLENIDPTKLLILDRNDRVLEKYPYVCQDFKHSIYDCLNYGIELIRKYNKLVLVFPKPSNHPIEITGSFAKFCDDFAFENEIIHDINLAKIVPGTIYLVIDDSDLVGVIKMAKVHGYRIGKDIGVISYNDTPLKEVVENGITVISTDFEKLGTTAAEHIINQSAERTVTPTRLIVRNSL